MSSVKSYLWVTAALFVLLMITVAAAYADLGAFNTPVAMLIAATKATLIILVFMNLRHADGLVRLFAAAGIFWLTILLVLTLGDFLTRHP